MILDSIFRTIQGRNTNINFKFNATVSAGKSMNIRAIFTGRNQRYYDLTIVKGRRETAMLSTSVRKIDEIWYCVAGSQAFKALTRDFHVGRELWRLLVGTRTDRK